MSLFEKTRRFNHVADVRAKAAPSPQLFKNLSVGPAGERTQASRTVDLHHTKLTRRRFNDITAYITI
mgnify:CR=1 FL=1